MVFQKPRQMGREMSREKRWLKHPLLVLRHRCQGKQPRSLPDRSKQEESGQEGVHSSAAAPLTGMPQLVQHQGLSGCNSTACSLQCCSLPATLLGGQSPSYLLGQSFIPLYPKRCHPPGFALPVLDHSHGCCTGFLMRSHCQHCVNHLFWHSFPLHPL